MSGQTVDIKFKINFPVILITVLMIHALLMLTNGIPVFTLTEFLPKNEEPTTLKIRRVKTARVEHSKLQPMASVLNDGAKSSRGTPGAKSPVSLKDLSLEKMALSNPKAQRPGTRPEVIGKAPKALKAISLKSKEFKDVSQGLPSGGMAISDLMSGVQKVSDAVVSIEVPDGIEPDELNKYELMFYGFQKRTAINYMNSILKNLNKFQKTHPHYKLPNEARFLMTARVTYDSEGNVMQIKMMRWTHVNELQNLFENVVKDIDQLHNPPKALWEKQGQFSMYYTLEILNG
ncbi:MAG: hypothetical protein ACLGHN_08360 [Bacteriovoracia bacterium]